MLVVAALVAGCALFAPRDDLLEETVDIRGSFAAELEGRPFLFHMLESPGEGGQPDRVLQIEGDAVIVSFHSSTPPHLPTIRGSAIEFGGHRFGVTPVANSYLIDGQPHQLPAPGIYLFSDGEFFGQYAVR